MEAVASAHACPAAGRREEPQCTHAQRRAGGRDTGATARRRRSVCPCRTSATHGSAPFARAAITKKDICQVCLAKGRTKLPFKCVCVENECLSAPEGTGQSHGLCIASTANESLCHHCMLVHAKPLPADTLWYNGTSTPQTLHNRVEDELWSAIWHAQTPPTAPRGTPCRRPAGTSSHRPDTGRSCGTEVMRYSGTPCRISYCPSRKICHIRVMRSPCIGENLSMHASAGGAQGGRAGGGAHGDEGAGTA